MMLHTNNSLAMSLPSINFLHFTVSEILPRQNLKVKVTTARSKVKSRSQHDTAHQQPPSNVPSKYQPYGCSNISLIRCYSHYDKFKGYVTSRSHYNITNLQPPAKNNIPTIYQLSTPYSFRDIARTRFYRSRSPQQDQRSNQGNTMTLHTYNPLPMSLPSINFLLLTVSEI